MISSTQQRNYKQNNFMWWSRGDLDGFFGLFVDNLIQLILITVLCTTLLGMPQEMVLGRILPGVAISLLIGNLFYAWQAKQLSIRSGKRATALPYGVNTVSLFAYVLFVMLPVINMTGDVELAWQMGIAACFGSGLIELAGAWVAAHLKQITPPVLPCSPHWLALPSPLSRWISPFASLPIH